MTTEYQGQPEYVVVGYLCDLFESWARACDNDEWGEFMIAIQDTASRAITVSDEERAAVLLGWFREEMQRAFDDDWWGTKYDYDDWAPVYEAQDEFERITADWRERSVSFKGEVALEETITGLPEWVRPGPDREPKPDLEREQYEKLKAKFEQ